MATHKNSNSRQSTSALALAGLMLIANVPAEALAQSAGPNDTAGFDADVVVTARRKAETLQSVPVQINVVTGAELEKAGIQNLDDLTRLVPGLQLQTGGGKQFNRLSIRGISSLSVLSDDPNVATFVDGVYVSGRNSQDFELLDLARVEVVKGPQNALYGRQAFAGAVNFVTALPDNRFTGHVSAELGSNGKRRYVAGASGAIVEDLLYARVAGSSDAFDGTYRDVVSGNGLGGFKSEALSATIRLTPSSRLDVNVTSAYNHDDIGHPLQVIVPGNCQPDAAGNLQTRCGAFTRALAGPLTFDPRAWGLRRQLSHSSMTATWRFSDAMSITSLTGYNTVHSYPFNNHDRQLPGAPTTVRNASGAVAGIIAFPTFITGGVTTTNEFMQDLRLQSTSSSPLQFIAGTSYYDLREATRGASIIDVSSLPAGFTATTALRQVRLPQVVTETLLDSYVTTANVRHTRAWAGYGSLEYRLGDLRGRAEMRYTSEEKRLQAVLPIGPERRATFNTWTPRVSLDYQATRAVLVYGSVAKGTISGGFNSISVPAALQTFGQSTNWTYEAGVKSELFDKKITANLNAFYVDISGLQLLSPVNVGGVGTIFVTQTVGTAVSQGFEIDLQARPLPGVLLGADYVYADTHFKKAVDSSLAALPYFAARGNDVSGLPLPLQAKHTLTLTGEYRNALSSTVSGFLRTDLSYSSRRNLYPEPSLGYTGARTIVNARLGIEQGGIEASLWVKNLFDNDVPISPNSLSIVGNSFITSPAVTLAPLRSWGATFGYRF